MASVPAPTEPGGPTPERPAGRAGASPLPRSLGPSSATRGVVAADRQRPGRLASTTRLLARQLGLGLGARETTRTVQLRALNVRFPDGVWAMPQQADDRDAAGGASLDPSFAAIVARYQKKSQPKAAPPARRGLPYALRRRHVTGTGVGTGPTAVANRTRPADARVPRNDGHGPDALAPRPKARARRPATYDEPGPPAAPTNRGGSSAVSPTHAATPARESAVTGRRSHGEAIAATMPPGLARFALAAGPDAPDTAERWDTARRPGSVDRPNARPRWFASTARRPSLSSLEGGSRPTLAAARLHHTARPLARAGGLRSATLTASSAVLARMPRTLVDHTPGSTPARVDNLRTTTGAGAGAVASHRVGAARRSTPSSTAPSPRSALGAPPPGSSASEWATRLAAAFGTPVAAGSAGAGTTTSGAALPAIATTNLGADPAAGGLATTWPSDAPRAGADIGIGIDPTTTRHSAAIAVAPSAPTVLAPRPLGAPRLRADAMWRSTTAGVLARFPARSLAPTLDTAEVVTGGVFEAMPSLALVGRAADRVRSSTEMPRAGLGAAANAATTGIHRVDRRVEPESSTARRRSPSAPLATSTSSTQAAAGDTTASPVVGHRPAHEELATRARRGSSLVRVGSGRATTHPAATRTAATGRMSTTAAAGDRSSGPTSGRRVGRSSVMSFAARSLHNAQRYLLTRSASIAGPTATASATGTMAIGTAVVRPLALGASASADTWPTATPAARRSAPAPSAPGASASVGALAASRPRRWDRRAGLERAAGRPTDVEATPMGAPVPGARAIARAAVAEATTTSVADHTDAVPWSHHDEHRTRTDDRRVEAAAGRTVPARAPVGAPLPQAYRSLAAALGNRRPVRVMHGADAREALRRAGAPAATVGNTILLDRAPSLTPTMRERIAHELVHTAADGPTPRLFGDPHHDHEERAARRVGRLARQLAPVTIDGAARPETPRPATPGTPGTVGTSHLAVSAPARPTAITGPSAPADPFAAPLARATVDGTASGSTRATAASTPTGTDGSAQATPGRRTSLPRAGDGRRGATVRAAAGLLGRSATSEPAIEAPGMASTTATTTASNGTPPASSQQKHDTPKRQSATERLDHLDEIVALVEARVLAELERRGGRHRAWM